MNTYMFELPPVISLAFEVLAGKWGNGEERKKKLKAAGYDYTKIQKCVDELVTLMNKYGG